MSDTVSGLQWAVATPAEKVVLFLREHGPILFFCGCVLLFLAWHVYSAYAAGRFPLHV